MDRKLPKYWTKTNIKMGSNIPLKWFISTNFLWIILSGFFLIISIMGLQNSLIFDFMAKSYQLLLEILFLTIVGLYLLFSCTFFIYLCYAKIYLIKRLKRLTLNLDDLKDQNKLTEIFNIYLSGNLKVFYEETEQKFSFRVIKKSPYKLGFGGFKRFHSVTKNRKFAPYTLTLHWLHFCLFNLFNIAIWVLIVQISFSKTQMMVALIFLFGIMWLVYLFNMWPLKHCRIVTINLKLLKATLSHNYVGTFKSKANQTVFNTNDRLNDEAFVRLPKTTITQDMSTIKLTLENIKKIANMPLKRFLIMNFLFVLVATSALITTILDLSKIINVQYLTANLPYFSIYFTLVSSILYLAFWFIFLTYLIIQRTAFLTYFNSLHRELNQLKNKLKTQELINFYLSGKINYFYDSVAQTWDWKITSGLFQKVRREDWKQYAPRFLLLNIINYTLGFFVGVGFGSAYSYSTLLPLAITCLFIIWLDLITCLLRAYPKILPLNHQLIKQLTY